MEKTRFVSLDWLRFLACVLVILQHVTEFYYVAPDFTPARTDNTFCIGLFNSLSRTSVPLFVIISGFLLHPTRQTTSEFFKRRFTRILYPFFLWSIVYSLYFAWMKDLSWMQWIKNVCLIPICYEAEHLWYIYMLIGLYVLVPVLSPWLKSISRRELEGYLGLWLFTTLLPYIRLVFPTIGADVFFNPSPTFYYFSGFVGYFLLGHYFRQYQALSTLSSLGALAIGWGMTSSIFLYQLQHGETIEQLELSWGFCTVNVVLMCMGVFSLMLKIKGTAQGMVGRWVASVSVLSYGIYLVHVLWLRLYMSQFMPLFDSVIPVALIVVPCTFISSYLTIWVLKRLPGSNYLC